MQFTLTIKGSPSEARAAMDRHDLGGSVRAQLDGETVFDVQVTADTQRAVRRQVGAWYGEVRGTAPYPPGTLLLWSEHPSDNEAVTA